MTDQQLFVGPFKLENTDWADLQRNVRRGFGYWVHAWFMTITSSAGIIFLGYVVSRLTLTRFMTVEQFDDLRLLPIAVSGVIALVYCFLVAPQLTRSLRTRQHAFSSEHQVAISSDLIVAEEGEIKMTLPWRAVARVVVTPKVVILFISPTQGVVVPFRVFPSTDAAKLFSARVVEWQRSKSV